ncbi:unnamed protein product, partial [Porites lobata]
GVICSWSDGGFLEVDLRHCQHPVAYHVLLTYPAFHISKASLNLTQGDEKTLFKHELATIKIKVTKLERKENVVTTTSQPHYYQSWIKNAFMSAEMAGSQRLKMEQTDTVHLVHGNETCAHRTDVHKNPCKIKNCKYCLPRGWKLPSQNMH